MYITVMLSNVSRKVKGQHYMQYKVSSHSDQVFPITYLKHKI